jgi:hypothetical protein
MQKLNKAFTATVQKSENKGGWTFAIWPEPVEFFKTRGPVKMRATVDEVPFESSFMALGNGTHKLPVKADVRKNIGKEASDSVKIHLWKG